ncbi:MAG: tRNA (N6-isopentenyl adenosine(37)-C2)-methylthiotransferase MiaB [Chloracidobacterium sp. CP2_5A]|nr:MAG: tRNA (N6-isopentenyl adenosine(37)-C2)-methylthiotransferase MiaB [Chloracidobacterium sp. CP2_5A]
MQACVITLGCQMNEYDTHAIQSQLAGIGYSFVDDIYDADLVLVNTCAVRGKPVEKARSILGALRKEKKRRSVTVGLMGCLAQLPEGQAMGAKFGVDLMLGPGALTDLIPALRQSGFKSFAFKDDLRDYAPPPPKGALSAHIAITRGCNHKCTYCIVPTTRGPEVSRPAADILREAEALRDAGVAEVSLLGQNVNSYGLEPGLGPRRKRLPGFPSFAELLRMVGQVGIPRVRFITSHPINFTDDIIAAIAETPAVCRYVHLPVQSGSNRTLRRMAREYTREYYLERVAAIRAQLPDATLSTDIICGFPGETEADFEETLTLYDAARFDMAFMFVYSEREGTPAAAHFDDIPQATKVGRLMRLIERQKHWSWHNYRQWVGRTVEALVKGPAREGELMQGHTRGNHAVVMPRAVAPKPGLYTARIAHATPHMLYAEGAALPEDRTIPTAA